MRSNAARMLGGMALAAFVIFLTARAAPQGKMVKRR
jgi:hypothetical protein